VRGSAVCSSEAPARLKKRLGKEAEVGSSAFRERDSHPQGVRVLLLAVVAAQRGAGRGTGAGFVETDLDELLRQ
jgi:hypothetical protein